MGEPGSESGRGLTHSKTLPRLRMGQLVHGLDARPKLEVETPRVSCAAADGLVDEELFAAHRAKRAQWRIDDARNIIERLGEERFGFGP